MFRISRNSPLSTSTCLNTFSPRQISVQRLQSPSVSNCRHTAGRPGLGPLPLPPAHYRHTNPRNGSRLYIMVEGIISKVVLATSNPPYLIMDGFVYWVSKINRRMHVIKFSLTSAAIKMIGFARGHPMRATRGNGALAQLQRMQLNFVGVGRRYDAMHATAYRTRQAPNVLPRPLYGVDSRASGGLIGEQGSRVLRATFSTRN